MCRREGRAMTVRSRPAGADSYCMNERRGVVSTWIRIPNPQLGGKICEGFCVKVLSTTPRAILSPKSKQTLSRRSVAPRGSSIPAPAHIRREALPKRHPQWIGVLGTQPVAAAVTDTGRHCPANPHLSTTAKAGHLRHKQTEMNALGPQCGENAHSAVERVCERHQKSTCEDSTPARALASRLIAAGRNGVTSRAKSRSYDPLGQQQQHPGECGGRQPRRRGQDNL